MTVVSAVGSSTEVPDQVQFAKRRPGLFKRTLADAVRKALSHLQGTTKSCPNIKKRERIGQDRAT